MKRSDVKKHISKEVRVAYVKNGVTIKTEGLLYAANPVTEVAEVWCVNKQKVHVHFSQLREIKKVIIPLEDRLATCSTHTYTAEEAKNAFKCLLQAYKALKFYGDQKSWFETISGGRFLGRIMDVKWKMAQEAQAYVEENFL